MCGLYMAPVESCVHVAQAGSARERRADLRLCLWFPGNEGSLFVSLQWHELELGLGICRQQHLSRIWYLALRIPAPLGALWQPGVCRKGKYPPGSSVNWSLLTCGVRTGVEQHYGPPAAANTAAKCSSSPIPVQPTRGGTF